MAKRAGLALLALGAAVALSGCGTAGVVKKGDVAHGKTIFTSGIKVDGKQTTPCASCHTLADAGSTSTVGPNLDEAFAFASQAKNKGDHFKRSTIATVVLDQILYPSQHAIDPKYVMPAKIVTGQDARDVAAYVASVAGKTS